MIKKAPKPKKKTQKTPEKVVKLSVATETQKSFGDSTKHLGREVNAEQLTTRERYYEAVGRRKESIARVRLYTKKATDTIGEEKALITVNGKHYHEYFTDINLREIVESPLKKLRSVNRFKVSVVVHGGGKSGQANAIKHGIARTLVEFDNNFRKKLKKSGYLTRDPRAKERRKYGLKKARKAPRWAKR